MASKSEKTGWKRNCWPGYKMRCSNLTPVRYAVEEFCRQLKEAQGNQCANGAYCEQKRKVQAELSRLVAAVAVGGHSTSLIEAIEQREQELQNLNERLNAWGLDFEQIKPV